MTCIEYNARQINKNAPYPIAYFTNCRDGSYRMYGYVVSYQQSHKWFRTKKEALLYKSLYTV